MMALGALAMGDASALGQLATREPVAAEGFPLPIGSTLAAEAGKPRPFVLAPVAPPAMGCAAAFDCRLRVVGAVQRNGAVELNAAVLKW